MATNTVENYLKSIFHLSANQTDQVTTDRPLPPLVPTTHIAEHLGVKSSTVTDMIRKLEERQLVSYTKYQGVTLTTRGKALALDIVRKHRLWEVFLVDKLGFKWDEVHDIAEQLEHVQSEALVNRLDDFLDNPTQDPHGDPIPDRDGSIKKLRQQLLSTLRENDEATIARITEDEPSLLHFLEKQGLQLNTSFRVSEVIDFDRSVVLEVADRSVSLSHKMASHIYVVKK